MKSSLISRIAAYVAAIILLQTLFFKFTAHPDSVYIFTELGIEPFGRIGIGILELITAVLLVIPKTRGIGGILGVGIISGAIFAHLTQLGIVVNGDGGTLFGLALVTFITSAIVAWINRHQIPIIKNIPFIQAGLAA
ncbi:MAG: DoxX family protein [Saprospiraceae bacterium]